MSILIASLLITVFTLGAVYEHLKSEDGIVGLATEDAEEEDVGIPKIWLVGMLSFFVGAPISVAYHYELRLSAYVLATTPFIPVVSLLADLTNTNSSWERKIGVITIVSIVMSMGLLLSSDYLDLFTWIIVGSLGGLALLSGLNLIGIYVYYRNNYFEYLN